MPRPGLTLAHDAHCVDCSRACIWLAMSSLLTGLSSTPVAFKSRSPSVRPQALLTTMVIDVPTLMAIRAFRPDAPKDQANPTAGDGQCVHIVLHVMCPAY
jgi:hypothetical protein